MAILSLLKMKQKLLFLCLISFCVLPYEGIAQEAYVSTSKQLPEFKKSAKTAVVPTFSLEQSHPDLLTGYLPVHYEVFYTGRYVVSVVGDQGKELKVLVDKVHEPGTYQLFWKLSSQGHGIYMYRMEAGAPTSERKLLLVKY